MKLLFKYTKDILITGLSLLTAFAISLLFQHIFDV